MGGYANFGGVGNFISANREVFPGQTAERKNTDEKTTSFSHLCNFVCCCAEAGWTGGPSTRGTVAGHTANVDAWQQRARCHASGSASTSEDLDLWHLEIKPG